MSKSDISSEAGNQDVLAVKKTKGFFVTKGEPKYSDSPLYKVVIMLLITSFFERSSYYWITSSQTAYLRGLGFASTKATNLQSTFQAIVYTLPILASLLIDMVLGRLILIPICFWFSFMAASLLSIGEGTDNLTLISISMFGLLAIGDAPIKPALMTLAGDQFDLTNEKHVKQKGQMFQMYYWFTNTAAAIAFFIAPAIGSSGMGAIDEESGYLWTFIIGSAQYLCGAILLTVTGLVMQKFQVNGAGDDTIPQLLKVSWAAARTSKRGSAVFAGFVMIFVCVVLSIPNFFLSGVAQTVVTYTVATLVIVTMILLIVFGADSSWVDGALAKGFNPKLVTDAKDIWRLMPYIAFNFPFWAVYNQMNTNLINQVCQANGYFSADAVGKEDAFLAPSSINGINCVIIVILIPLFEYAVFPAIEKCGVKLTLLRKMGAGLIMASLTVATLAGLEYGRRGADHLTTPCTAAEISAGWCSDTSWLYVEGENDIESYYRRTEADPTLIGQILPVPPLSTPSNPLAYTLSSCVGLGEDENGVVDKFVNFVPIKNFSIYIWIIALGLMGAGEILFAATCTDFFYSEVPSEVRAAMQSINMINVSLGTLLGGIVDVIFSSFAPENLDRGNLEFNFFTVVGLGVLATVLFVYKSRSFVYRIADAPISASSSTSSESEMEVENSKASSEISSQSSSSSEA